MKYNSSHLKNSTPKSSGFTIVELLIVIVIIGILAALVIVAYNGLQAKARDTKRKSDLAYIAKALKLYETDNGNFIEAGSGCGAAGNGHSWFNLENGIATSYPISTHNCLKNAGYLKGEVIDPSGNTICSPSTSGCYMKDNCGASTYILANLETLPHTSTDTDATCQPSRDTSYGMNYFVKVE